MRSGPVVVNVVAVTIENAATRIGDRAMRGMRIPKTSDGSRRRRGCGKFFASEAKGPFQRGFWNTGPEASLHPLSSYAVGGPWTTPSARGLQSVLPNPRGKIVGSSAGCGPRLLSVLAG